MCCLPVWPEIASDFGFQKLLISYASPCTNPSVPDKRLHTCLLCGVTQAQPQQDQLLMIVHGLYFVLLQIQL